MRVASLFLIVLGSLVAVVRPESAHAQGEVARAAAPVGSDILRRIKITTDEGTISSIDVSPDGKTILFDLLGQLFTLDIGCRRNSVERCKPRQLTEGPAFYALPDQTEDGNDLGKSAANAMRPHFSQDGRFVLFRSDEMGGRWWRLPADCAIGRGARCAPEEVTSGVSIAQDSADAKWMIREVRKVRSPGGGANRCEMIEAYRVIERASGKELRVASSGSQCAAHNSVSPAITPDGRNLIATGGGKLYRIDVITGAPTPIPFRAEMQLRVRPLERFTHRVPVDSFVRARRIEHPRLSPDASRLAFSALNRVWIMSYPDGVAQRLTAFEERGEFEPAWSPDGRYVAFSTWTDEGGGSGDVYRVRVDGACADVNGSRVGVCAPERLTHERAYYSNVVYAPNGAKLLLVMRPLRWLRRQNNKTDSWTKGDAELAWIPPDGGVPVYVTTLEQDDLDCLESRGTALATPHFLRGAPDSVLLFQTDSAERGTLRTIPISNPDPYFMRPPDTALVLRTRLRAYSRRCADVLLSPDGSHALVWVNQRELLLIDPAAPLPGVRAPTLDDLAASARRIVTPYGAAAEFAAWSADGKSFTYSAGRFFYRYDLRQGDSLARDSMARAATGNPVRASAYVPAGVSVSVLARRDLPRGTIAFRNGRIITMRGNEVLEKGDIVVKDRRILAVGPAGSVTIPQEAHVVDATGRTIVPGFVDVHSHVEPLPNVHRTRVWQYEANLAYGVLALRDPQAKLTDFLTYEDLRATGELLAPRLMSTGRGIGSVSHETITNLADARAVVARYVDLYDVKYLKEYALWARAPRQWLTIAAAERGLNVVAHSGGRNRLVQGAFDGYGGHDHVTPWHLPFYKDALQLLALTGLTIAHGLFETPLYQSYFEPMRQPAAVSKIARLYPPAYREYYATSWSLGSTDVARRAIYGSTSKIAVEIAKLIANGVHVAVGGHGDPPGLATHFQVWAYVEMGRAPHMDALRSATLRGAEALGLDKDLGSIEVGKLGNLLVLEGNPLESIRATGSISYVLFDGRLYDATTLNELWPRQVVRSPLWWREALGNSPRRD